MPLPYCGAQFIGGLSCQPDQFLRIQVVGGGGGGGGGRILRIPLRRASYIPSVKLAVGSLGPAYSQVRAKNRV